MKPTPRPRWRLTECVGRPEDRRRWAALLLAARAAPPAPEEPEEPAREGGEEGER